MGVVLGRFREGRPPDPVGDRVYSCVHVGKEVCPQKLKRGRVRPIISQSYTSHPISSACSQWVILRKLLNPLGMWMGRVRKFGRKGSSGRAVSSEFFRWTTTSSPLRQCRRRGAERNPQVDDDGDEEPDINVSTSTTRHQCHPPQLSLRGGGADVCGRHRRFSQAG